MRTSAILMLAMLQTACSSNVPLPVALEDPVPLPLHDGPINISIGVYVDDFSGLSEDSNTFKLDFWLNLNWVDIRNNFTATLVAGPLAPRTVAAGMQTPENVWLPDVTPTNSDRWEVILSKMRVYPNGTTIWMRRIVGDFEANLDYRNFPFDEHVLTVKLECKDYFEDIIALVPWYTMTGMKSESKSAGSYNWNVKLQGTPRDHCDIARDDSICADFGCMTECEKSASVLPEKLVLKQHRKSAFSGAPKGSMLASGLFAQHRITVSLSISRRLGNTFFLYFLPSVLLVVVASLSFSARTSDLSTRLAASLVGLLTFEVMSDRMFRKVPASESIMWGTVWHIFHVSVLGGIVIENGMANYLAVCVYDYAGTSLDKMSFWVFLGTYFATFCFLVCAPAYSTLVVSFTGFVVASAGGFLVVYGFLVKAVIDVTIVVRLIGETHVGGGPCNMWGMIEKYVLWRQRGIKKLKHTRWVRRSGSHLGLALPDDVLERFAFERIARKADYYHDPLSAQLTEAEFTRATWKSFAKLIPTGRIGSIEHEEFTKAVHAILCGLSVAYDPPAEKSDLVPFKRSSILKKCFLSYLHKDVNDVDEHHSKPTSSS